mgnify:CR=1 FL=1
MVFPEKQSQPARCRFSALPREQKLRFQQRNSCFPVTEFTIQRHLHERAQRVALQIQELPGIEMRRAVVQIADALNDGMDAQDITYIDGTVYKTREPDTSVPSIMLPAFPDMQKNPRVYAESFSVQYRNTDPFCAKRLIEPYGEHEFIVQNPPQKPLSQKEMDHVYDLPYCRTFHPSYKKLGGIPAIAEIEFSLTSCRGCFGACSFCALTFHQGRIIQTRSQESIIKEAEGMTHSPGFKGYIHDVGGPSANFPPAKSSSSAARARQDSACSPPPAKT